jgi:hypothetical protein
MEEQGDFDAGAPAQTGRRSFMKKAAIGATAAWVTPVVLSRTAFAAGSGTGTTTSLPIGGPPSPIGPCGMAIILPGGSPGSYTMYNTASAFTGYTVTAISALGGGSINTISPALPYVLLNSPPITITTTGTITGFQVTITC